MVAMLRASSWPEACAALVRAKGQLGDHASDELRRLLDQGTREVELATRSEEIRLYRAYSGQLSLLVRPDKYEEAFRRAGLGQVGDDPEVVADRVRASNIQGALVVAFDHWSVCTNNPRDRSWVLNVARLADPDPTGWRARARDPAVRADPAVLVEVIKAAPVADQPVSLVLALERHLPFDSRERLPFLKKVQQAHPSDFWANYRLGKSLVQEHQPREAIRYFQAAVAIRPRSSLAYHELGSALSMTGWIEQAIEQYRRAVDIDPTSVFSHEWRAVALFGSGRQDEAIEQLRAAIGLNPRASGLQTRLGHFLEHAGRDAEALSSHRQAVALDPKNRPAQDRLRALLARLGKGDEARVAWQRSLAADPPEHEAWYGYAEFCLFIGEEDEYLRARQALLARFGATANPLIAQRTAQACLLRPASGDELRQAVALAERAAAVEPSQSRGQHAHVLFAQGLAEYRKGRHDQAIVMMRGETSAGLGPAPRLVLAMACTAADRWHRPGKRLRQPSWLTTGGRVRETTRPGGSSTCSAARRRA